MSLSCVCVLVWVHFGVLALSWSRLSFLIFAFRGWVGGWVGGWALAPPCSSPYVYVTVYYHQNCNKKEEKKGPKLWSYLSL